jgi:hypothetical protein
MLAGDFTSLPLPREEKSKTRTCAVCSHDEMVNNFLGSIPDVGYPAGS